MSVPAPRGPRRGLTLLEVAVTLSVIALLVSLLLPAILKTRGAARGAACQNNLRQVALALGAYETTFDRLPKATLNTNPLIALLPFVDEKPLAAAFDLREPVEGAAVAAYLCPDDAYAERPELFPASYGYNMGTGYAPTGKYPDHGPLGPFTHEPTRPDHIRDGRTTTAAFAEIVPPVESHRRFVQLPFDSLDYDPEEVVRAFREVPDDAPVLPVFVRGTDWRSGWLFRVGYRHHLEPNTRNGLLSTYTARPHLSTRGGNFAAASSHPGLVNVAFLDGAVRPVRNEIELSVWRALGSANGEEVVDSSDL